MSLKNGDNSIIIVGGSNAAFDPNMTELYTDWESAIKNSNPLEIFINKYRQNLITLKRDT